MLYTRRDVGRMGLAAGLASAFGSKTDGGREAEFQDQWSAGRRHHL